MENIKKKITDYLNSSEIGLTPLDKNETSPKQYTGVTINYLKKYIVPKYTKEEILDALCDLHNNHKIRSLFCGGVNTVVFEGITYNTNHWNYDHSSEIRESLIIPKGD